MQKLRQKNNRKKGDITIRGSIIILALVMTSILLTVGMGISGIAMKEIKLSSLGSESGRAFYMADTGAECALYWDVKNPYLTDPTYPLLTVFPTSSQSTLPDLTNNPIRCLGFDFWQVNYPPPPSEFCFVGNCNPFGDSIRKRYGNLSSVAPNEGGWYIVYDNAGSASVAATTTFILKSSLTDDSQPCAVVVIGKRDSGSGIFTTIDSRGRSSCDNNPRRVERGLKVSY